jgi:hypothetical protein
MGARPCCTYGTPCCAYACCMATQNIFCKRAIYIPCPVSKRLIKELTFTNSTQKLTYQQFLVLPVVLALGQMAVWYTGRKGLGFITRRNHIFEWDLSCAGIMCSHGIYHAHVSCVRIPHSLLLDVDMFLGSYCYPVTVNVLRSPFPLSTAPYCVSI